jgi:thioredoxin reductase (NADPH)
MTELTPGMFIAEIGQLAGQPALIDAEAQSDVETLLVPRERLRDLVIAEDKLGGRIMRALILRRTFELLTDRADWTRRARSQSIAEIVQKAES